MTKASHQQFVIDTVTAPFYGKLALSFADGYVADVDLSGVIRSRRFLARLRDPKLFTQVALDEWRRGVVFGGDEDLALASDNLRAMSLEQKGEYSHRQIIIWMDRHGMTLDQAAEALGVSRRMLAYYRSGEKAVPKTVGLAMSGWEHQKLRLGAA